MKLLQNILVTIDFSPSSDRAVKTAAELAKLFNSQVTLMHVMQGQSITEEMRGLLEKTINSNLTGIKTELEGQGVAVKGIVLEHGVPFEKIIEEAQINDYNVLVAGSGNKPESDAFKLGTTVEKLMRKNQVPLWVVKNEEPHGVKKIVCPVDFSEASKRALQNAITLAQKFKAELTVLNVFEPVSYLSKRFEVDNAEENKELMRAQEKQFYEFLKNFNLDSVKHEPVIRSGLPNVEILNHIKENGIDLLLIGTTGSTVLSRLLMGSVTEKVTRETPCSFITVKAKDITDDYFESNLKSIEAILNSARRLMEAGEYEVAIDKYNFALKQHPDNIPAVLGMIDAYEKTGKESKVNYYKEYAKEVIRRIWGEDYLKLLKF